MDHHPTDVVTADPTMVGMLYTTGESPNCSACTRAPSRNGSRTGRSRPCATASCYAFARRISRRSVRS